MALLNQIEDIFRLIVQYGVLLLECAGVSVLLVTAVKSMIGYVKRDGHIRLDGIQAGRGGAADGHRPGAERTDYAGGRHPAAGGADLPDPLGNQRGGGPYGPVGQRNRPGEDPGRLVRPLSRGRQPPSAGKTEINPEGNGVSLRVLACPKASRRLRLQARKNENPSSPAAGRGSGEENALPPASAGNVRYGQTFPAHRRLQPRKARRRRFPSKKRPTSSPADLAVPGGPGSPRPAGCPPGRAALWD